MRNRNRARPGGDRCAHPCKRGGVRGDARSDLRTIIQAIRAGWLDDAPPEKRQAIIDQLLEVQNQPAATIRKQIAAALALLAASQANAHAAEAHQAASGATPGGPTCPT